jgi:hypothetical protein
MALIPWIGDHALEEAVAGLMDLGRTRNPSAGICLELEEW